MNLQESLQRIKEIMDIEDLLPEKPDYSLFNEEWLSKLNVDDDYVKLYHYGPSGLEYLDPENFGKNRYSMSEQWWGKKRIFFYTDLKDKERFVGGQLYEVKVKLSDLYPFNTDPLNLYDFAVKKWGYEDVPVKWQIIYISNMLEKIGYKGMIYRWTGSSLLAVIWEKIKILDHKPSDIVYNATHIDPSKF